MSYEIVILSQSFQSSTVPVSDCLTQNVVNIIALQPVSNTRTLSFWDNKLYRFPKMICGNRINSGFKFREIKFSMVNQSVSVIELKQVMHSL